MMIHAENGEHKKILRYGYLSVVGVEFEKELSPPHLMLYNSS